MKYLIFSIFSIFVSCNSSDTVTSKNTYKIQHSMKLSEFDYDHEKSMVKWKNKINISVIDSHFNRVSLNELSKVWKEMHIDLITFKGDTMEEILYFQGHQFWYISKVDLETLPLGINNKYEVIELLSPSTLNDSGNGFLSGFFHSKNFDLVKITLKVENWVFKDPLVEKVLPNNSIPSRPIRIR